MNQSVHFSSQTDRWETPQWLFDLLDGEFDFGPDVAALPGNAKCQRFFSPDTDLFLGTWKAVGFRPVSHMAFVKLVRDVGRIAPAARNGVPSRKRAGPKVRPRR